MISGGWNHVEPMLILYGTHWCPDCRRSKQFLGESESPYRWIDLEEIPTPSNWSSK